MATHDQPTEQSITDFTRAETGMVRHLISVNSFDDAAKKVSTLISYERLARLRLADQLKGFAANTAHAHMRRTYPVETAMIDVELAGSIFNLDDYARRLKAAAEEHALRQMQYDVEAHEREEASRARWAAAKESFRAPPM